jgi:hypothetical protein
MSFDQHTRLASRVLGRYLRAMELSKRPLKKQLESLKREHETISDSRTSGWNNDTQARDVHFFVGWDIEPLNKGGYGFLVTAPNGKSFEAIRGDGPALSTWLRDETNYLELLDEKIAEVNRRLREERIKKNQDKPLKPGGFTGTCSVCFTGIKLRNRRGSPHPIIVLHGYQRPGIGYVNGRCPGVDFPPFELSSEGTEAWVKTLEGMLEQQLKTLAALQKKHKQPVEQLDKIEFTKLQRREETYNHQLLTETFTPDHPDWETAVKRYRRELDDSLERTEKSIQETQSELKNLRHRIASWKPRPLV